MQNPEIKICQRCHSSFECRMNDIANCQCNSIVINQAGNDFLKKTKYDCLCKNCLAEINRMAEFAKTQEFPRRSSELKQGLHFYMDNGLFVFTEFYHMHKGSCCGNDCRHCAYGFEK